MTIHASNFPKLIDQFGRQVDYIRLSITDRCDFRCQYCMSEDMTFLPRDEVLSLEECARIVRTFVQLGVTKVRITGGEPLVRKNALWLFEEIGHLQGLDELVLTTNGSQLSKHASALKQAGVKRINISLDSLDAERFKKITRIGDLDKVLHGLEAAIAVGFDGIKLNTVLMRDTNDDEAEDLVSFAIDHHIDISFIEEMPLGDVNHQRDSTFVSNADTLKRLQSKYPLIPSTHTSRGPARYWQVANTATKIGSFHRTATIFARAATVCASAAKVNCFCVWAKTTRWI